LICFVTVTCHAADPDVAAPPEALTKVPVIASFDDLVADLDRNSVTHTTHIDRQVVLVPTNRGPIKGAMLIRWAESDGVVHFGQDMGITFDKDRLRDVESAAARINHGFPIPGVSVDSDRPSIYFRTSVPFKPDGHITSQAMQVYFSYTLKMAFQFQPTMQLVAEGKLDPADALAHARTEPQNPNAVPDGTFTRTIDDQDWTLTIQLGGGVELHRDNELVVRSKCSASQSVVSFDDVSGELAAKEPGRYRFRFPPQSLRFELVDDASPERQSILSGGDWKRRSRLKPPGNDFDPVPESPDVAEGNPTTEPSSTK